MSDTSDDSEVVISVPLRRAGSSRWFKLSYPTDLAGEDRTMVLGVLRPLVNRLESVESASTRGLVGTDSPILKNLVRGSVGSGTYMDPQCQVTGCQKAWMRSNVADRE